MVSGRQAAAIEDVGRLAPYVLMHRIRSDAPAEVIAEAVRTSIAAES
jgi:AAA lid domain